MGFLMPSLQAIAHRPSSSRNYYINFSNLFPTPPVDAIAIHSFFDLFLVSEKEQRDSIEKLIPRLALPQPKVFKKGILFIVTSSMIQV